MGCRVRPGRRSLGRNIRRRTPSPQTPRCPGPSGRPSCTPSVTDSLDPIDSGWCRFGPQDPTDLLDGQDVWPVSAPLSPPPVGLCTTQDRRWSWLETCCIFTWSTYLVINGGPAGPPPWIGVGT